MKKIILIGLVILSVLLFTEKINASELNLINILETEGPEMPDIDIGQGTQTCSELLGTGAVALIKLFITAVRIVAVIIAIVISMLNFIPPIMAGNPNGELQKALKKTVKLYIVLVIVVGFPNILNIIGQLFEFDLSCIV